MPPARTYVSISPSTDGSSPALTGGHARGWRAGRLLGFVALLSIVAGCAGPRLPEDVRETFRNGQQAEDAQRFDAAVVHYSAVLESHPDLVPALIARGQCRRQLAAHAVAEKERLHYLRLALTEDFEKAAAADTSSRDRVVAEVLEISCLLPLHEEEKARKVLEDLTSNDAATKLEKADAHRLLGELILHDLHRRIPVDGVIAPDADDLLAEVRKARFHFGECLERRPDDARAMLGKGICLLHEGLLEEAADFLGRARDKAKEPKASIVYLCAVARERRLGPNVESNKGFVQALRLDRKHNFDAVYLRLYRLLREQPHAFDADETAEIVSLLIEYDGPDVRVWKAGREYFTAGGANSSHLDRLGLAVSAARLGDAAAASAAFRDWAQTAPATEKGADAIQLAFQPGPDVQDPLVRARLLLERCRAYCRLCEREPTACDEVIEDLRGLTARLDGMPGSAERDLLLADASGLLSEQIVRKAQKKGISGDRQRELLQEAESSTLIEKRLRSHPFAAEFRLGRIEQLLDGEGSPYPLATAIRVAQNDPSHSYAPAYQQLVLVREQLRSAKKAMDEKEKVRLSSIEAALLDYRGDDPDIRTAVAEIQQQRAAERRKAEEERRKEEERRAQEEKRKEQAELRPPCPVCGYRAPKSDKICPECGSPLPPLKDAPESKDAKGSPKR